MAWRWVPEANPGQQADAGRTFSTQGEAESWLGEFYPDLVADGVDAVSLFEEDRRVYGPMGLHPEQ
ncbi:MAG TPA: hypothetical protein VEQ66_16400 [Propionibacteriaceae bacterium]|nr:hypothetical protein [Propionibacteriaceae bacterium]